MYSKVFYEMLKTTEKEILFFGSADIFTASFSLSADVQEYLQRVKKAIQTEDPETQKMFKQEFMLFVEHAD